MCNKNVKDLLTKQLTYFLSYEHLLCEKPNSRNKCNLQRKKMRRLFEMFMWEKTLNWLPVFIVVIVLFFFFFSFVPHVCVCVIKCTAEICITKCHHHTQTHMCTWQCMVHFHINKFKFKSLHDRIWELQPICTILQQIARNRCA